MDLDEFIFESPDSKIDMVDPKNNKSNYFDEFLRLIDNEYLINNVIQSEFKYFCETRMKKVEIDDEVLTTRQKLQHTSYYAGCLTKIPEEKESYIEDVWKLLHNFFNDVTKSKSIYASIKDFIKKMMIFSPALRTEIILQMIKFANNEIIEERVKVWQSLAIMSNYVMVEESFFFYFLNYVYSMYNSPNNDITVRGYASFVFVNAIKNRSLDDRSVVPTINQIRSILRVLKMSVEVFFDDEKSIIMPIEIFDTCEQLKQQIFKVFKWKEDLMPFFGFYETKDNIKFKDENFIEDFVRVSDVLASWELAYAARNFMPFGDDVDDDTFDESFKIYLRPRYYHYKAPNLAIKSLENTLLICELIRQIREDRIKVNIKDLTHAIALYCSMKLPETNIHNMVKNVSKIKKLTNYLLKGNKKLAIRVLYGDGADVNEDDGMKETFSEMLNIAQDFELDRKKEEFLGCFAKNSYFKSQNYKIKFSKEYVMDKNYPPDAILCISPEKIGIINEDQSHLKRFKFDDVKSVSVFKRNVVLIINQNIEDINDNDKNLKFVFEANQAENIYKAIQNYVSIRINGFFKDPEIKYDKIYEDDEDMALDFELLDHLLDPSFALDNTNRYMKKKEVKAPKVI